MIKTTIAFATGCCLILMLPTLPVINWFWMGLLNIFLLVYRPTRYLAILLLAALWTIWHSQQLLDDRLEPEHYGHTLTITGIVDSVPNIQNRALRFNFKPVDNDRLILPKKIRLSWYQPYPSNIIAGQKWQLSVKLKPPSGMMNPGGFDYEGSLFQQGIGATGYIKKANTNIKIADNNPLQLNTLRQKLATKIKQQRPDSKNIGLMQGLLVGVKHNISSEQWQILRQSGTSHLLAISGLHIGLAAAIGFYLLSLTWSIRHKNLLRIPAKQVGALGAIFFAFVYAALAGFSIPTQRALIMVTVFMTAILMRKTISKSQLLAIAACLILIVDPIAIIAPGFWLSFSAVIIILFISQHRFPNPKWQWAKIHLFIAFGLTPTLLFFFTQTSLIAPITNSFAVPLMSLIIIPLLLLATALLSFWPEASQIGFMVIDNLLHILMNSLAYLSNLPYSNLNIALPSAAALIAMIIATCLILLPKGLPGKWLAVIGFLPILLSPTPSVTNGNFKLTLLDVGQGLSSVIQTENHTLVFDTGAKFSDHFNAGAAVIIPFLQHQAINHLDTLVISHSDNDHIGGAKSILSTIPTTTVLTSQTEQHLQSNLCISGQSWQWDNVNFEILSPSHRQTGSSNNLSCVLKVSNMQQSVLLTGDIEKKTELKLIQQYPKKLASSVLIAPHHGSKTSSTQPFIDAVAPQFVLFPAGYLNRYHFPNEVILKRYLKAGVTPYISGESGAISMHFQHNKKPIINTWRQQQKKIWTRIPTE